jgi:hypothetical protein
MDASRVHGRAPLEHIGDGVIEPINLTRHENGGVDDR